MGFEHVERRLPREAPGRAELAAMAALLPGGTRDLVAVRGQHWQAKGVDVESLSDEELLDRLLEDPLALRRPLLWLPDRVLLGHRPGVYAGL